MKKIPTVFRRGEHNRRYVTPVVHHECEWVLAGEGIATRKYDGMCCMFDGTAWWARREVKHGKQAPPNFVVVNYDETTGKTVGWEPMEQSPFARWHAEAVDLDARVDYEHHEGTYELCGPKVNGNPEGFTGHVLIRHADAEQLDIPGDVPRFDVLRDLLHGEFLGYEGIVWHHPDGRMAKVKARDFERPESERGER